MKKLLLISLMCLMALTMQAQPGPTTNSPKTRTSVEVLYGYLKIFPNELGTFQDEPRTVIAQINKQAQHGYNNWRIPTNEELSLMRANNYLGSGEYMTRESKRGIVLLVTDGDDLQTIQAAEEARIKAEQERIEAGARAEQEHKAAKEKAKQERLAYLKAQGFVDLGLPSETMWKDKNEEGGFYTYEQALYFGDELPTTKQMYELKEHCQWSWTGSGYKVTGPNGNSILLPAAGYIDCDRDDVHFEGDSGWYWSSGSRGSLTAYKLSFYEGSYYVSDIKKCYRLSVRLVHD